MNSSPILSMFGMSQDNLATLQRTHFEVSNLLDKKTSRSELKYAIMPTAL